MKILFTANNMWRNYSRWIYLLANLLATNLAIFGKAHTIMKVNGWWWIQSKYVMKRFVLFYCSWSAIVALFSFFFSMHFSFGWQALSQQTCFYRPNSLWHFTVANQWIVKLCHLTLLSIFVVIIVFISQFCWNA